MRLLPWVLPGLAIGVALLPFHDQRRVGAAGLVPLGLGLAALHLSRTAGAGLPAGFLAVNAVLILSGLAILGMAVARRAGSGDPWETGLRGEPVQEAARPPLAGYAAGLAAATLGPHLGVVFGGMALAAWCGCGLGRHGAGRWMAVPALASVLLLLGDWVLATIAGPEGLAISAIPLLPLSPAAERGLALVLLLLIWLFSAIWPLRPRGSAGTLTPPLAMLLLVRIGLPAVPVGLAHWQPLAFPLVVMGVWGAGLGRDLSMLARAGAMLGLASLDRRALPGAAALLLAALGTEWLARTRVARGALWQVGRTGIAAAVAWGGFAVAVGGLRAEVVYTVLGAIGTAVGLSRRPPPPGEPPHPAR